MKCDDIRERLVDLLDGASTTAESEEIEGHLAACSECEAEARALGTVWSKLSALPEAEPGPGLRARFDVMLEAYRAGQRRSAPPLLDRLDRWLEGLERLTPIFPRRPAFQLAAAFLCLGLGGLLGVWLSGEGSRAPGRSAREGEGPDQLSVLSSEVRDLRNLVALSLLQQTSSSERLRGVSFSNRLSEPQPDVIEALTGTLNHDPNVNVRLAAIDALTRFANREGVRHSLLRSLPQQESPLVQIALIDLMVQLGDKGSVELLRALAVKPEIHPAVRERARWGMDQIS